MPGRRQRLARRLPLPWVIAWRYMAGQRSQMLASTARAALIATTLGVTAMVIAMALMTGYSQDLRRKLVGLQAEVTAVPIDLQAADAASVEAAAALDGVERIGRVAYGDGSLSSPALPGGVNVFLRGVDAEAGDPAIADPARLAPGDDGLPRLLLGVELLRRLGLEEGDPVRLVVMGLGERRPRFRYQSVMVGGTFATGFAEFDASWAVIDRATLEALRGDTGLDLVEFHLRDDADVETMTAAIEAAIGPGYAVSSWQRLNRELFAALELQELLLFLVLGLIVVVSTFNVASTLVILVRERMRDIGVLGALGLEPRQLWTVFTVYGLLLGALGIGGGVAVGGGISWLLTTFELVRFGPEIAAIYFIDSVPFRVEALDVAAIVAFSLVVTVLACALPALRAATIEPSAALRYE